MAFDEEKATKFRQFAVDKGYSEQAVDRFLSRKRREPEAPAFEFQPDFDIDARAGSFSGTGDLSTPEGQGKVLASAGPVTQRFGAYNPQVERFSGGVNLGADFGTPQGTKVAVPQGEWVVLEAFGGARAGNRSTNRGYGNSVLVRNRMTGEMLRFSHLSRVGVRPGQLVKGGQVVALSGSTGNSTGPHSSIMFIDSRGRIRDVLKSRYKNQIT